MVASHGTVEQMVRVILKYLDRRTALKLARELHNRVEGNKSVVDTFARIAEHLTHMDES